MLLSPVPDTTEPMEQGGKLYDYFLETFIAREVIEGLAAVEAARPQMKPKK